MQERIGILRAWLSQRLRVVDWLRVVVEIELGVIILIALVLTIAPQVSLTAVAGAATQASEFSTAYRPLVALLGLVILAASGAGLWAMIRAGRAPRRITKRGPSTRAA